MRAPKQPSATAPAMLVVCAIALAAAGCYTQLASGGSEHEEDPREQLSGEPPVKVVIERIGLEGYVSPDGPTVIAYRLENRGPARRVTLEMIEWPPPEHVPWGFTVAANTAPLEVELGLNETARGDWILPQFAGYQTLHGLGESDLLVLARDEDGALVGVATVPEVKHSYWPVVVIAADSEIGLAVQDAVHRADLGQGVYATRHEVALLLSDPPGLWYELAGAGTVILASPWAALPDDTRVALRRHVAFGGSLHVLPEHCPDWRAAEPVAGATPGLLPTRFGAGRVFVEPIGTIAQEGGRETWFARTIPGRDAIGPGWSSVSPPLTMAYVMPDTWLLVALIVLIVALIGPVAHLVLVRMRKREWSWVVIPALSVVLAGCMYGVASSVKGEDSALEVHHLVQSFGNAPDAAVTTAVRIQSAEAGLRSVRITGEQPRASFMSYAPFGSEVDPRKTGVDAERLKIRDIPMHRFSSHDLTVTVTGGRQDVEIELIGENGVRVVNRTGTELTDLYLERPGGWVELAERLGPGKILERRDLGPGTPEHELLGGDPTNLEAIELAGLLGAATSRRQTAAFDDFALVAGCGATGLPEVEMSPAPRVQEVRVSCAWLVTRTERIENGVSP